MLVQIFLVRVGRNIVFAGDHGYAIERLLRLDLCLLVLLPVGGRNQWRYSCEQWWRLSLTLSVTQRAKVRLHARVVSRRVVRSQACQCQRLLQICGLLLQLCLGLLGRAACDSSCQAGNDAADRRRRLRMVLRLRSLDQVFLLEGDLCALLV